MRRRLAGALVALLVGMVSGIAAPTFGATPAAAAGPGVLLVGDSVLAAFNYGYGAAGVAAIAGAYTPKVDAVVCRKLTTVGCKPGAEVSALQVLQAQRGRLAPYVVMTVGYNEHDAMPAKIDAIMREALAGGAQRVIWPTYQNVHNAGAYAANNVALHAAAARWPQLRVADWRAHSAGQSSWFSTSDGVHLTGSGAAALGRFLRTHLDAVALPPPPDPRCSPGLAIGTATSPIALPADAAPSGARLTPVTPVRLADTRAGWPGAAGPARLAAGRSLELAIAGRGGVPGDATGVVVNLTIVDPCHGGFATVYPAGTSGPPIASTSNFAPGQTVASLAVVRLGVGGAIGIYSSGQADVLVDVVGYLHRSQGARFNPIEPLRLYDSRPTALGAGQEVAVTVRGAGGGAVPAGASVTGAALNLTVTEAAAPGFLTASPGPCSAAARPTTSNLNFGAGQTIANLVLSGLGADGSVCVATSAPAEVIIDVTGWFGPTGADAVTITPQRVVDTRATASSLHPELSGRLGAAPLTVPLGLSSGVPAGAAGVLVNVTVVGPVAPGWLVAYPCGSPVPPTSNVNFTTGEARPNLVAVKLGSGDTLCLLSSVPTDVIVDLAAWFR